MNGKSNDLRIVKEFICLFIFTFVTRIVIECIINGCMPRIDTNVMIFPIVFSAILSYRTSSNVQIVIDNSESNRNEIDTVFQKKKIKYIEDREEVKVYKMPGLKISFWPLEIFIEELDGKLEVNIPKGLERDLKHLKSISNI